MQNPPLSPGEKVSGAKEESHSVHITLRDIARQAGVSHATVSLALRNSPQISVPRRNEIQRLARELGYRPNPMAASLGHQRHSLAKSVHAEIAWINCWSRPERLRSFREFDLYWQGASEVAQQYGFRLQEVVFEESMTPLELEKSLVSQKIQGILLPPHAQAPRLSDLKKIDWSHFTAVRLGFSIAEPAVHVIGSNHIASGRIAVENIQRLGYKRIGFVTAGLLTAHFRAGFFLKQAEVEISQRIPILTLSPTSDHFTELPTLSAWLEENRPDAILTDIAETREMLERLGYRVPDDIGLAATSILDGKADAGLDQNSKEIGKAAVETLVAMFNRNIRGIPDYVREVLITGKWVDGSSMPAR